MIQSWISQLSQIDYILLGILAALFVWQVYYYIRYMAGVSRAARKQVKKCAAQPVERVAASDMDLFSPQAEGVSVIVCARNEAENIRPYLQTLLEQDYPLYEVILVNDGSEDATQQVIDEYVVRYARLRTTFVPVEARVKSSKKLALTLGIKAARYDYILLTDADCRPESNHWIHSMMDGFASGKDIVLGYGAYFKEKKLVNGIIQYDTLFNGLQYLGMALAGHPYMGVGRNLAYRKNVFTQNNGFAGMLNDRAGDDDLFVNRNANPKNTAVVISQESITWSVPKQTVKEWLQQKRRHLSVSSHYRGESKFRLTLEPLSRGVWYMTLILVGVLGTFPAQMAALALFLARWIMQMIIINLGAKALKGKLFGPGIIWYDIVLPLINLHMILTAPAFKKNQWW